MALCYKYYPLLNLICPLFDLYIEGGECMVLQSLGKSHCALKPQEKRRGDWKGEELCVAHQNYQIHPCIHQCSYPCIHPSLHPLPSSDTCPASELPSCLGNSLLYASWPKAGPVFHCNSSHAQTYTFLGPLAPRTWEYAIGWANGALWSRSLSLEQISKESRMREKERERVNGMRNSIKCLQIAVSVGMVSSLVMAWFCLGLLNFSPPPSLRWVLSWLADFWVFGIWHGENVYEWQGPTQGRQEKTIKFLGKRETLRFWSSVRICASRSPETIGSVAAVSDWVPVLAFEHTASGYSYFDDDDDDELANTLYISSSWWSVLVYISCIQLLFNYFLVSRLFLCVQNLVWQDELQQTGYTWMIPPFADLDHWLSSVTSWVCSFLPRGTGQHLVTGWGWSWHRGRQNQLSHKQTASQPLNSDNPEWALPLDFPRKCAIQFPCDLSKIKWDFLTCSWKHFKLIWPHGVKKASTCSRILGLLPVCHQLAVWP